MPKVSLRVARRWKWFDSVLQKNDNGVALCCRKMPMVYLAAVQSLRKASIYTFSFIETTGHRKQTVCITQMLQVFYALSLSQRSPITDTFRDAEEQ